MHASPPSASRPESGPARAALDWLHALLAAPAGGQPSLDELLRQLADVFGAAGAGLAALAGGPPQPRGRVGEPAPWPWDLDPALPDRLAPGAPAVTVARPDGGSALAAAGAAGPGGLLVWLDDPGRSAWSVAEAAALTLAAQVLAGPLAAEAPDRPRWADQVDRAGRQQCLEVTALVTRRLAHDFGNVLTGILGFAELSLTQQVPAGTPLHTYLTEVHRAAQNGAQFTHQLRLFSRRQAAGTGATALAGFLAEEERRTRAVWGHAVTLELRVPPDLPPAAIGPDQLRPALAALLENAREAAGGGNQGTVRVAARAIELTPADCLDLFGDVRPGLHLELSVTDNGPGLSPEAERRLFAEPFFSTKPRRRGFGLALAYGVAAAHRGGLRVRRAGERGTVARLVLPAAPAAVPAAVAPPPTGERVLVVDDDRLILQFVCSTLERAGYRVYPAASAEEALAAYEAAAADPFRLVLTDVAMPHVSGVDLVRRLLRRDPGVRVLFMSGQVSGDFADAEAAGHQFDLLQKPFRPDGLVRAVRAALERAVVRRSPAQAPVGGGPVPSPAT